MEIIDIAGRTWVSDKNGNRNSVKRWGSVEAATTALNSNANCIDCIECHSCDSCKSCDSCNSCYSCKLCYSCYSCKLCDSCNSCYSCDSCNSCYSCDSCKSCKSCDSCQSVHDPIQIPVIPDIHRVIYEAASQPGALDMSRWHCGTTHCRAGWVTKIAGPEGLALEERLGVAVAAMAIYRASDPQYRINPAQFYASNEQAMADMKMLAERGGASDGASC